MNKQTLLKKLSVEEKINLTSGHGMWTSVGNDTIQTRNLVFADGPHGVRVYKKTPGTEGFNENEKAPSTLFPSAAAMASTFNPNLIYNVGKTIAKECNHYNVDVLLGPGVNLKRSPLGGRNFEYYSEDPYLTGIIATNFINGVQSEGVGACIKHFALNEQENLRRFISSEADERTIHELYLLPFEMAIKNAKPSSIMGSYNKVNGHYACESQYLLKDVLREQWGYKGLVMSDWGGVQNKVKSIKNGMNLEMPGNSEFNEEVRIALKNNELTEQELDDSLLPVFDLYDFCEENPNKGKDTDFEKNHNFASKVSEEAIVLLENDGILPLKKGIKLGVIGDFAQNPRINGGGSASLKSYKIDKP
ncbi:glycosyl hydrolase, partial [Candidatus Izimaplasma bacterium]|nr:glycosyl hydrolase [Candidatus Izimaplasma bacterium]